MRATLSILGLYEYDNTIFDLMSLPGTLTKEDVANQICFECAELEVLYPSAVVMKNMIGLWSAREYPTWARVLAAAEAEYNPIENYDRSESISRSRTGSETHSGKDTSQDSGTDTTQDSGTDTTQGSSSNTNSGSDSNLHKYASFDASALLDQSSDTTTYGSGSTGSSSSSTTYGRKNELTHGRKNELTHGHQIADSSTETENNRIHGNIGVTTSQQMLEQELEIAPKLNILSYIVDSFKRRFCLLVY